MGRGNSLSDNCLMFSVVVLNVICGLLGALVFALALWMRLEQEVREWVRELDMTQYWTGLYILMAAGAIIVIVSLCGCCGALMSNPCLLATNCVLTLFSFALFMFGAIILLSRYIRPSFDHDYFEQQFKLVSSSNGQSTSRQTRFFIFLYYNASVFTIICLILEIAGAIYIIINGTQSNSTQRWLDNKFSRLIVDSNYNPTANRILQIVQEKVGCCGARNYQDYDRNRLPISDFCRDSVSGNVYQEGCVEKFSQFIEKRSGWIAGIALFIGALQIMLICITVCYWRNMREEDGEPGPRHDKRYTGVASNDY